MAKKRKEWSGIVYSTDPDFDLGSETVEEGETLPPKQQVLKIELDRKLKGGKKVTRVFNFVGTEADLKTLGKLLQQKCGCGGGVKDSSILLQGDFREKIKSELTAMGYKWKQVGG
jgi:translation initiation factor 1